MSKKGGGAGDGKITPKNPSLRMRPRGGFLGGGRRGGKSWFWGNSRNQGFEDGGGLPQEVARRELVLSKQTLLRSNETSCQETKLKINKQKIKHK